MRQDRDSLRDAFPERMDERIGWIREAAGARFEECELSVLRVLGGIAVTPRPLKVAAEVARLHENRTGLAIDPRDVLGLVEPAHEDRVDPPAVADAAQLRDQVWDRSDQRIGRLEVPAIAPVIEQLAGT